MTDTTTVAAAPAEPRPHTLDDVMIAMDVVDTLRHRDDLVSRELNEADREGALISRLREIYREQGIEVPDDVLAQGVKALKDSRFTYSPPPPSWTRTLLELWVRRVRYARLTGITAAALVALWGTYYFAVSRPAQEARRQAQIEITETLPNAIRLGHSDVVALATDDTAKQKAEALLADGQRATRDQDVTAMRRIAGELNQLRQDLTQQYALIIAGQPGETTGVWRRPPRGSGRNYYLIVEAVAADGKKMSLPIRNEETGQTETVSKFGVRVPQETYDAVAADKRDDGIIQRNRLGEKRRGKLTIDYFMPHDDGFITKW